MSQTAKKVVTVTSILNEMASFFGRNLGEDALEIYVKLLSRYSLEQVRDAANRAIQELSTFPVFADLKKFLDAEKEAEMTDAASLQATFVRAQFEIGEYPQFDDPISARIMAVHLPWKDWKNRAPEELDQFFYSMFTKKYREIAKNPAELKRGKENIEKQNKTISPTLPRNEKLESKNKDFLKKQMEHNDWDFSMLPDGRSLGDLDRAIAFYPHRYAKPINFSDAQFIEKFREATFDEAFLNSVGEWDFEMKLPKKKRSSAGWDEFIKNRGKQAQGSTQIVQTIKTTTRTIGTNLKPVFEAS